MWDMDINFHYFAVKALAHCAGFEEAESQRIAEYSQYVDDFSWRAYIECKNIPEYIAKDPELDLYIDPPKIPILNFSPVTTGFAELIDFAFLILERSQLFTTSPFHFVPQNIKVGKVDKDARTTPTTIGDGSIIGDLLVNARTELHRARTKGERDIALMRIGIYLHTFADTYAHQLFTGFYSWANDVKVVSVTDENNGNDITELILNEAKEKYEQSVEQDANLISDEAEQGVIPPIGHAIAGSAPDYTFASIHFDFKKDKDDKARSLKHIRSNTTEFLTAAEHIFKYLVSCADSKTPPYMNWNRLSPLFFSAFRQRYDSKTKHEETIQNWKMYFGEVYFSYKSEDIEKRFYTDNGKKNYTEEFYRYNYITAKRLTAMYGPKPRKAWWNLPDE